MEKQYAFLMIDYETPQIISDLQRTIKKEELYVDVEHPGDYGLETDTHVTIAPCLPNDVDIELLRSFLRPLYEYPALLTNISIFDNEKYDVLKCDVASDVLISTNKAICDAIPTFSEYKEYHPHATIAYTRKGASKKYTKDVLIPLVVLKPKRFRLSWSDENGRTHTTIFES